MIQTIKDRQNSHESAEFDVTSTDKREMSKEGKNLSKENVGEVAVGELFEYVSTGLELLERRLSIEKDEGLTSLEVLDEVVEVIFCWRRIWRIEFS